MSNETFIVGSLKNKLESSKDVKANAFGLKHLNFNLDTKPNASNPALRRQRNSVTLINTNTTKIKSEIQKKMTELKDIKEEGT